MTRGGTAFDDEVRRFRWSIPARLNIGVEVVDRWAAVDPTRPAIVVHRPGGGAETTSYGALKTLTDRFAVALAAAGIGRGDRVAVLLPQSLEAVVAHVATYKLGAVALPLSVLFGPEALAYRLKRSGARAVVAGAGGVARMAAITADLPDLVLRVAVDGAPAGWRDYPALIERAAAAFTPAATGPADPAMMIFTSGTTGLPKPALHGHAVLAGHMPGITLAQDGLGRPGDVMWTPADWAWAGGLLNALLPALAAGVPVLAHRFDKFDPDEALALMARHRVTNAFLPPTALRLMRGVAGVARRHALVLRAVGSAGEALGREAYAWAESELGLKVNEFYGQTECNAVIGSAHALGVGRPGAIGKPLPGHHVAIVDAEGRELPPGTPGQIAIRRPDPVMFLGYAGDPAATAAKFVGDFLMTGDTAVADADGMIAFVGRDDDVITSAGYRIGPGEIEDCLAGHPAVEMAVVVGVPDPVRTEVVKAFVKLRPGAATDAAMVRSIQAHVRERLSAHEYPREVAFVEEMPLTTSGKLIRRLFRDPATAPAAVGPG